MARKTCFLQLKDGDLNLVNLKLKGQALRLARLVSFYVGLLAVGVCPL